MSDIIFSDRPMCDSKGCENVSNFHGFSRNVCWCCYARLLQSGGFYSLTHSSCSATIHPSDAGLTTEKTCGLEGQLTLQF
jgi:hypothetical protein